MPRVQPDPQKAVAYVRASTRTQAHTIEAQRERIRAWAETRGMEVVGWCIDAGRSGSLPPSRRPGLADALIAVEREGAGFLLVTDRSRLSRDAVGAALIDRALERFGARVVATDSGEAVNAATAEGKFVRAVLDAAFELERELVKTRTRAILRQRRAQGFATGGRTPLGWRRDGERLVPEPLVAELCRRVLAMHARGVSVRKIAAALAGQPASPGSAGWSKSIVHDLITRHREGRLMLPPDPAGGYTPWGQSGGPAAAP